MTDIQEYYLVILTQNIEAIHKENYRKILLRKGQVGTVIMDFEQKPF